ncbi:MAG TPA: hypothetical protein PKZ76_18435 [Xanthomonadaceae bacterium]|nr:hypothetical protein [Luteimonas sp.]HRQ66815.1 hypothetical protein [Xanthomonadaceae bacterium]
MKVIGDIHLANSNNNPWRCGQWVRTFWLVTALWLLAIAWSAQAAESTESPWKRERLILDLPSEYQWDSRDAKEEGPTRNWKHKPVATEGVAPPFDEIDVSTIDKQFSPYSAREMPKWLYGLFSSYDDTIRMLMLHEVRGVGKYEAAYKFESHGAVRSVTLGYVRESKAAIHMVTMELSPPVDPAVVKQWTEILINSRLTRDEESK